MPSRLSCSPRAASSLSATAATILYSLGSRRQELRFLPRTLIIHFYLGLVADGPDDLITAGHNLVALAQAGIHLDIGGAGNAGFHLTEHHLIARNDEDALDLLLARLFDR